MLIDFRKPKKIRSTEEHNKMHTSDSGVAGTYVPNMSDEDAQRWKGKYITGDNERIEIRKSFYNAGVQVVIVVRRNPPVPYPEYKGNSADHNKKLDKWRDAKGEVKISMNGSLWLSFKELTEMEQVIDEARTLLYMKSENILKLINDKV